MKKQLTPHFVIRVTQLLEELNVRKTEAILDFYQYSLNLHSDLEYRSTGDKYQFMESLTCGAGSGLGRFST